MDIISKPEKEIQGKHPFLKLFEIRPQDRPILTWIICSVCVGVFIGLHLDRSLTTAEAYTRWGWGPVSEIRAGRIWFLFTSSLVHFELWHLAFNLYWLYKFGAVLERKIGWVLWIILYVAIAFVASTTEIAISDDTGIGASGVVYGFFGFLWVTKDRFPAFRAVIHPNVVQLFIIWLFLCVLLTATGAMQVANGAHFGGLIMGALAGFILLKEQLRIRLVLAACALAALCSIPLIWAPWSASWTSQKAIDAFSAGKFEESEAWAKKALRAGQDKSWVWDLIARSYVARHDYKNYRAALAEIRNINPEDADKLESKMKPYFPNR